MKKRKRSPCQNLWLRYFAATENVPAGLPESAAALKNARELMQWRRPIDNSQTSCATEYYGDSLKHPPADNIWLAFLFRLFLDDDDGTASQRIYTAVLVVTRGPGAVKVV
ncbi:hypothetical protein KCP78_24645 [Salmonella enterica subsp. enterica]|nr:hypothetical protein KCP78_24645 [Salmonella enterica subsp. enterica]